MLINCVAYQEGPRLVDLPVVQLVELVDGDLNVGEVAVFAGIWGMNFETMPELKLKWGCPAAPGLIFGIGGSMAWRFRRAGWL